MELCSYERDMLLPQDRSCQLLKRLGSIRPLDLANVDALETKGRRPLNNSTFKYHIVTTYLALVHAPLHVYLIHFSRVGLYAWHSLSFKFATKYPSTCSSQARAPVFHK